MARPSTVLLDLPPELQLQIFSYLDYSSRLALSRTDRYFRSVVEVEKPTTVEQKLLYLCAVETWTGYCFKMESS